MICLVLIMLCPLALVGCDKNYTITISVEGGGSGAVLLKNVENISVVGKNAVKEGEKFEYVIKPANGYEIGEIKIDGVIQTGYDKNDTGFAFEDIKDDHTVVVKFVAKRYEVSFYCLTEIGGTEYEVYKTPLTIAYGQELNLNESEFGGEIALWYERDEKTSKRTYCYNGSSVSTDDIKEEYQSKSNILYIRKDKKLFCDKTALELESMLVTLGL